MANFVPANLGRPLLLAGTLLIVPGCRQPIPADGGCGSLDGSTTAELHLPPPSAQLPACFHSTAYESSHVSHPPPNTSPVARCDELLDALDHMACARLVDDIELHIDNWYELARYTRGGEFTPSPAQSQRGLNLISSNSSMLLGTAQTRELFWLITTILQIDSSDLCGQAKILEAASNKLASVLEARLSTTAEEIMNVSSETASEQRDLCRVLGPEAWQLTVNTPRIQALLSDLFRHCWKTGLIAESHDLTPLMQDRPSIDAELWHVGVRAALSRPAIVSSWRTPLSDVWLAAKLAPHEWQDAELTLVSQAVTAVLLEPTLGETASSVRDRLYSAIDDLTWSLSPAAAPLREAVLDGIERARLESGGLSKAATNLAEILDIYFCID